MTRSRLMLVMAMTGTFFAPLASSADVTKSPGIIAYTGTSATMSTKDMPANSEMWAMWVSLPPGKKTGMPGPEGQNWMDLELALTGETVTGSPTPEAVAQCVLIPAGGREVPSAPDMPSRAGDAFACPFGPGSEYWEENRGAEVYSRAQLNIGGPFVQGTTDTPGQYTKVGGEAFVEGLSAGLFGPVEEELRAAGAMTASIRQATMPPGSKTVVENRYPSLRMVIAGALTWGVLPAGSGPSATPERLHTQYRGGWVQWYVTTPEGRIMLSNTSDKPVQFVEWSVVPAPEAAP